MLFQPFPVFVQQDDVRREIPRADDAGLHVGFGRFGVFPHEQRVPVYFGVRIVQELVKKADDLLVPALDEHGDLFFRVELIKTDEARGIAQLKWQKVERRQHGRPRLLRQAVDGNHGKMLFPQTRLKPAHKVFFADERVQIHGRFRHAEIVHAAGDAALEPGQQIGVRELMPDAIRSLVFAKTPHFEPARRAGVLKFRQRMLEPLQVAAHVGRAPFPAGGAGHARGARVRQPGQHGKGGRDAADVAPEKGAPFLVQHARDTIRKAAGRGIGIGAPRRARGVHMEHPSRTQPLDGGADLHGDPFQLRGHGAGGILSAHFVTREKRAVLLQHDARRNEGGIGQQIGQPFGF